VVKVDPDGRTQPRVASSRSSSGQMETDPLDKMSPALPEAVLEALRRSAYALVFS